MQISTKFNVDDTVYVLHENEIVKGEITRAEINRKKLDGEIKTLISYHIRVEADETKFFYENEVFATLEELLGNLIAKFNEVYHNE